MGRQCYRMVGASALLRLQERLKTMITGGDWCEKLLHFVEQRKRSLREQQAVSNIWSSNTVNNSLLFTGTLNYLVYLNASHYFCFVVTQSLLAPISNCFSYVGYKSILVMFKKSAEFLIYVLLLHYIMLNISIFLYFDINISSQQMSI